MARHHTADQNVQITKSVLYTCHVLIISVQIRVKEHVLLMQNVELSVTPLSVFALRDILVIPFSPASKKNFTLNLFQHLVRPHLADLMLYVKKEIMQGPVLALKDTQEIPTMAVVQNVL